MSEPEYSPDAMRKLNETMGVEPRERTSCGIVIKDRSKDKGYAKKRLRSNERRSY